MLARSFLWSCLVALFGVGCGVSEAPAQHDALETTPNPGHLRNEIVQRMLSSAYEMTIASTPPSQLDGQQWLVSYEGPGRYAISRTSYGQIVGDSCQGRVATNGESEICHPVTVESGDWTVSESVWIDGVLYFRICRSDRTCDNWETLTNSPLRPATTIDVAPFPESPIKALESAHDLALLDEEAPNDANTRHLWGLYNPIKVLLAQEFEAFGFTGGPSPGAECSGMIWPSDSSDVGFECQPINYADEVRYYEVHPAEIDVWVSSEDTRVIRLTMTVPRSRFLTPGEEQFPEVTLDYRYLESTGELSPPDLSGPN